MLKLRQVTKKSPKTGLGIYFRLFFFLFESREPREIISRKGILIDRSLIRGNLPGGVFFFFFCFGGGGGTKMGKG